MGAAWAVMDLSAFPERDSASVTESGGSLTLEGRRFELADVAAVWLRRFAAFGVHRALRQDMSWWVRGECNALLAGILQSMPESRVMNPLRVAILGDDGLSKLAQLTAARAHGLEVPRTAATNDPVEARAFAETCHGGMVYKAFHQQQTATVRPIFTTALDESMLATLDRVRRAPCLLQELVPKALDLRVTVVGDRVFACAIKSQEQPNTRVDYRVNLGIPHEARELPRIVEHALVATCRSLGLVYGACDLILTPDGRYVFVEVNQAGQFDWVEDRTGLNISEAVAEWLTQRC
jgi:glutathione synthase/RimK-type ligase-like ATP-grasp enzyme